MNRLKLGLFVSLMAMGLTACNPESNKGPENGDGGPNKTPSQLPNVVVTYENEVLGVGGVEQSILATSESWQDSPNTILPYDPAEDDPTLETGPTSVNIRSRCESTTYTMEANPREIVLYDIDGNYTWPGAILQGRSFRQGSLKLLSVDPAYRTPATVVISNLYTQTNGTSKSIEQPTFSEVSDAIKSVIAEAFESNIPSGSATSINISETKDLKTFFMKAGFSGKTNYGLGKVKASLDATIDTSTDSQTLVIQLTQKMFDVELQQPPKPQDWFTEAFFTDELPILMDGDEIGSDNPPVYVSKVTYGRMITATISSKVTSKELEAIINLTYDSLTSDGTASLNTKMHATYTDATKSLIALGGNETDATTALDSGNWSEFFKSDFFVTEAVPLMISFKNLYDNSPAGTTETTEHTETICEPYIVVDGAYDFKLTQTHQVPEGFSGANIVKAGDVNNDEINDLVWNNASGSTNQVYVTLGSKTGDFKVVEKACVNETGNDQDPVSCDLSNGHTDWSLYDLNVGDFNGDGFEDLIWVNPFANNQTKLSIRYVFGSEQGFDTSSFNQVTANHGLASVKDNVLVKDINGDGKVEVTLSSNVYPVLDNGVQSTCESTSYKVWLSNEIIFKTTWDDEAPALSSARSAGDLFCNSDMNEDTLTDNTKRWYVDVDGNGKLDRLINMKGVSWFDTGSKNNMVKAEKLAGFRLAGTLYLDTDNRNINQSGHSLKNKNYWQNSIAAPGQFNGIGESMVWLNKQDGTMRGIYWDNGTQQWYESSDAESLFNWTADDVTDLSNAITDKSLFAVDINDDKYDDLTFYASTKGQGSSFANELWLGTVLSAKQEGGPNLFNADSASLQKHPVAKDWSQVTIAIPGKFDGDDLDDIVFVQTGSPGKIYVARAKAEDM